MSLELAHLVIERAPLKGHQFASLLYLALNANRIDATKASGPMIAKAMRMSEWRAQKAITELETAGWIVRMRYGEKRNPNVGYYFVIREVLFNYPRLNPRKRRLAGIACADLDAAAAKDMQSIARAQARVLHELAAAPKERMAILARACKKERPSVSL